MVLASKPSASNTRKQKTKAVEAARLGTVEQRSKCPVLLESFVSAVKKTRGVSPAVERLRSYPVLFDEDWLAKRKVVTALTFVTPSDFNVNFTIPRALLHTLAISTDKACASRSHVDLTDVGEAMQYVSRIEGAHAVRGFTLSNLAAFKDFYETTSLCNAYERAVAWLTHRTVGDEHIYPYPAYTTKSEQLTSERVTDAVVQALASCALETSFSILGDEATTATITVAEIVGHLAGDARLNDSVLVFALRQIADARNDILVMDSVQPTLRAGHAPVVIPCTPLSSYGVVIFPVNLTQSHWGLIVVAYNENSNLVMLYDPLVSPEYVDRLRQHGAESCEPFVEASADKDQVEYVSPHQYVLESPKQSQEDSTSCGIYCIAVCTDLVASSTGFEQLGTLSHSVISELRLRTLWSMVCKSRKGPMEENAETRSTVDSFAKFSRGLERELAAIGQVKTKAKRAFKRVSR